MKTCDIISYIFSYIIRMINCFVLITNNWSFQNSVIPQSLFIREELLTTDLKATVGSYELRSYGGKQ